MALEDDFCDIVRKARFGLGLTLDDAAARAGLAPARLQALETGETPSAAESDALAQALGLRAAPLSDIAFGRYVPPPVASRFGQWTITPVFAQDVGAYCYAVASPDARFAVDAGGGLASIRQALGSAPMAVLLTHGHQDHVAALEAFGAPAYAHPELAQRVGAAILEEGAEVFGLKAFYAPGHSPDMLAFSGPGFAFVGDTLFAGSLGRARGAQDYETLLTSARRILSLPDDTALFCGHGPATTVGSERVHCAFPV